MFIFRLFVTWWKIRWKVLMRFFMFTWTFPWCILAALILTWVSTWWKMLTPKPTNNIFSQLKTMESKEIKSLEYREDVNKLSFICVFNRIEFRNRTLICNQFYWLKLWRDFYYLNLTGNSPLYTFTIFNSYGFLKSYIFNIQPIIWGFVFFGTNMRIFFFVNR